VIDEPDISIDELLEIVPGPDFPTGGVVCGASGIRRGYHTGAAPSPCGPGRGSRSTAIASALSSPRFRFSSRANRVEERIAAAVNEDKIAGISGIRNESDLNEPVVWCATEARRRSRDRAQSALSVHAVAGQLLADLLALVDGKPRVLSFKNCWKSFSATA